MKVPAPTAWVSLQDTMSISGRNLQHMGGRQHRHPIVLEQLKKNYEVTEKDIGSDARLDKGMMHFTVRSFDIAGIGTLCLLNMKGMFGLMKMETIVLSCITKDVPLLNLDTVSAMGKTTRLAELYDTRISRKDTVTKTPVRKSKTATAIFRTIRTAITGMTTVCACPAAMQKEQRAAIRARRPHASDISMRS